MSVVHKSVAQSGTNHLSNLYIETVDPPCISGSHAFKYDSTNSNLWNSEFFLDSYNDSCSQWQTIHPENTNACVSKFINNNSTEGVSNSDSCDEVSLLRKNVGTKCNRTGIKRALLVSAVSDDDVQQTVVVNRPSGITSQSLLLRNRIHTSLSTDNVSVLSGMRMIDSEDTDSCNQNPSHKRGRRPLADNQFKCSYCHTSYRQRRNLLRHLSAAHKARDQVVNMYCLVPGCGHGCVHVDQLRRHLREEHQVNIVEEILLFKSLQDFQSWRYNYQKENNSSYVISTGKQKCKDGSEVFYFNCSRSGRYKSQNRNRGTVQRCRITSQKLGGYCPSTMKVIAYPNGQVKCILWPVHYFHDLGTGHIQNLRLQQQDREIIADRLRNGKTSAQIVAEFTKNFNPDSPTRLNFICRKDIVNVRMAYNLPPSPTIYNRGRPRKNQWTQNSSVTNVQSDDNLSGSASDLMDNEDSRDTTTDVDEKSQNFSLQERSTAVGDSTVIDDNSNDRFSEGRLILVLGNEGESNVYCLAEDGQQVEISNNLVQQLPDGSLIPINVSDLQTTSASVIISDVSESFANNQSLTPKNTVKFRT